MSMDQWKDNNDGKQMSLFDYQMPTASFVPAKSSGDPDYNWNSLYFQQEPITSKVPRFVTLSGIIHAVAIAVIAIVSVPVMEDLKTETVTIEIEDLSTPKKMALGSSVAPTRGANTASFTSPAASTLEEATSKDDVVVAKELPLELPKKTIPTKELKPLSKPAAKASAAKTNFAAVPATIDDIEAPELDQGALDKSVVASADALREDDLNEDLSAADAEAASLLEKEKRSLNDLADTLANEQDDDLAALAEANQQEADRLQNLQENLKQKNAAAIAAAQEREAKALAAQQAEEAAAAAFAAAQAEKKAGWSDEAGKGQGKKSGLGAGNNGANKASHQVAGAPTGVRSLDQLRQMPGNPRPQYDRIERRRGDQGEIAFVAYISKEGFPTRFKMLKSTGFRNLDGKTLAALKKWRFYPGQEGWVEIPFRWDLKGGVQQDGGTLRRSASNL